MPSLSFYLSHNFTISIFVFRKLLYIYCCYCPSEIPIVTILRNILGVKLNLQFILENKKLQAGGGNFLLKFLRKNFEK